MAGPGWFGSFSMKVAAAVPVSSEHTVTTPIHEDLRVTLSAMITIHCTGGLGDSTRVRPYRYSRRPCTYRAQKHGLRVHKQGAWVIRIYNCR